MAWITLCFELPEATFSQLEPLLGRLSPDGLQVEDDVTLGGAPLAPGTLRVTLYVPPDQAEEVSAQLRSALAHLGEVPPIAAAPLQEQNWNATWRAHFKPLEVGRHLRVEPVWDRPPPHATRRSLVLDPGLAFGTGTHETTQLACAMLEDWIDAARAAGRDLAAIELLDVGTGSAILSMAAVALGLGHATGTEVDADALENASDHLDINHMRDRITLLHLADPDELAPRRWELVAANIISGILLKLRDALVARVRPGGTLLISGVLAEEESRFLNAFTGDDLSLLERHKKGQWLGFRFRRRA